MLPGPQRVYDNIKETATKVELIDEGNGIVNAWAAIPFPIPKSGYEVLWNHFLRFQGKFRNAKTVNETTIYNSGKRLEWTLENKVHLPLLRSGLF